MRTSVATGHITVISQFSTIKSRNFHPIVAILDSGLAFGFLWDFSRKGVFMRTVFLIAHILVQLSAATPVVAQLPPEVLADSYLLEVEQAFRDGDHNRARAKIREILDLQAEHELNLPELEFWKAKAADSMDSPEQALEFVLRYLTMEGRKGRHYLEALMLMNRVQTAVRCKGWETEGHFSGTTVEEVSSCLDTGVDLEARDGLGRTPLHRAASQTDNPAVIETLINSGAGLEAQDDVGHTPLVVAVVDNESSQVVETLLNAGANPNRLHPILQAPGTDLKMLEGALEPIMRRMAEQGREAKYRSETLALMNTVQRIVRCEGWETEDYFRMATPEKVSACLGTGVDLEARDEENAIPLHRAAALSADPAVIESLLKAGSHPIVRDVSGRTPLHWAAEYNNNPAIAQALLNAGADANADDESGNLPLHYAARSTGNPAVIAALQAAGADPLVRKSRVETGRLQQGETDSYSFIGRAGQEVYLDVQARDFNPNLVVHSPSGAQFYGHYLRQKKLRREILSLLLDKTGEYQIKIFRFNDDKGKNTTYALHIVSDTPLGLAIQYNENVAVIEALLKGASNPELENSALLHRAARYTKNPNVIQMLLSNVSNPNKRDPLGRTPLHYAAHNGNPEVIKTLLKAGGDPKMIDVYKWSLLHHAAAYNSNPRVIQVLLNTGADLEKKANVGDYGATLLRSTNAHPPLHRGFRPLHLAGIYNENPAIAQALINAGAKLRPSAGRYNDTPLRWAARYTKNPAVVRTLLAAGAELHDKTYISKARAVHYAAINENPAVIHALLSAGANPNARTSGWKRSPLHFAAYGNKNPAVIQALVNAGAKINARDDEKWTPLHRAAHNKNPAMIQALLMAGANPAALDKKDKTPLDIAKEYGNVAAVEVLRHPTAAQGRQIAAVRAQRKAQSGSGVLGAAIGIIGGTAIAAAGGGSEEALVAGTVFAEGVIGGQSSAGSATSDPGGAPTGNVGASSGSGQCEIPGYPRPANVQNMGLSWCPATVDFQVRVFALQAAGAQCAIATGSSSTAEQIQARRQEIQVVCERLAALGVSNCQCP